MKNFIYIATLILCLVSCSNKKKTYYSPPRVTAEEFTVGVEDIINTDQENMYLNYSDDFNWCETCIVYNDYLDSDSCKYITEVCSIFYILSDKESKSYDTKAIIFTHKPGSTIIDEKSGFWVTDLVLSKKNIKISFEEAFKKLGDKKPHSKFCVLCKVSAKLNPQYVFGNAVSYICVDAVTGEITKEHNPGTKSGFWSK